jgi:hypothetical protein
MAEQKANWFLNHDYIALAATAIVTPFLETFQEFPPRQKAASFTIDQALDKMKAAATGGPVTSTEVKRAA